MFETFENNPCVLILGAGLMQIPAIEAAKKNGFKAVVVDANPNAVGVPCADAFSPVDLKDKDGLLAFAKTIPNLKGVFTAGTDFSASVAFVAKSLGLSGHEYEACLNASNKVRMRSCFEKSKVGSPSFESVKKEDIANVLRRAENMKYPLVIKPSDNMGARGCRMIRDKGEFESAVLDAVANSRSSTAILEDYMAGSEYSIDSIVYKGTLTITGFADRHIFYPPYFIETGHSMPTLLDSEKRRAIIEVFARGVASLGLTEGCAKGDVKFTKNGAMIGEIAARLSGGYMSGWTYPYASGVNLTEQALLVAVGKEPSELLKKRVRLEVSADCPFEVYDLPCEKASAERAWISIPGVIKEICGFEEAKSVLGVKDVLPRNKEGDAVDFPRNNVQKCGNVISVSDTFENAQMSAHEAIRKITLRLEPNNKETDAFLRGEERESEKGFPPFAYPNLSAKIKVFGDSVPPVLEEGKKAVDWFIPELLDFEEEDWNHCSIRQTLERFDTLCPNHKKIDSKTFLNAILRGGIQGALYIADCVSQVDK